MYKWPLSVSSFSLWDKFQVAWFILTSDRYTMGEKVKELEWKLRQKACYNENKFPYCLLTSSGSGAISLLFDTWKQINKKKFNSTVVIVPAVTWSTSASIPLLAGYEVKFCDINLNDLSFDYDKLEKIIKQETTKGHHVILWPTCLLGFVPNIPRLKFLAREYGCDLWMDCAEATQSQHDEGSILSCCDNTITSMYFSHNFQSGGELGALFTKSEEFYEIASCVRCHGQTKVLDPTYSQLRKNLEKKNPTIDKRFLFGFLGNNYRPMEISALFTLLDLKRWNEYAVKRVNLYNLFYDRWQGLGSLNFNKIDLPQGTIPFAIPIFLKPWQDLNKTKEYCESLGVETRSLVAGDLLRQPAFRHLGNYRSFPNAEVAHSRIFYIGLHPKLKEEQVTKLAEKLNGL